MTITVVCDSSTAPQTYLAVEALGQASGDWSTAGVGSQRAPESELVGLIVDFGSSATDRFLDRFTVLWNEGVRRFVLFAPEMEAASYPWHLFPTLQRSAFEKAFEVCNRAAVPEVRHSVLAAGKAVLDEWAALRLQRVTEAHELYKRVRDFVHGTDRDLTNQFLGPARLLLLADVTLEALDKQSKETWTTVWTQFDNAVLAPARVSGKCGQFGTELLCAAEPITRWLGKHGSPCVPEDLDRFMALLTECRVASCQSGEMMQESGSGGKQSESGIEPLSADTAGAFRVLVIDDHAVAWRPVFKVLQGRLAAIGCVALFEFSRDAESVWAHHGAASAGPPIEWPIQYGSYHLVVLDIFLSGMKQRDGRDVLMEIRRAWPHLPVLLWTTSRDIEITSKASQPNAVLLKKTISWEAFAASVQIWSPRGLAAGAFSLPSVFFNHVIQAPADRELVRSFFAWGLTQLDSFHALDGEVFRFFTDHGGRHIVKLLELFDKALQPFILDKDQRVLSMNPKVRQFEYLSFCLVVICHELGMFPMKVANGCVENFAGLGAKGRYLDDVRQLHAPRGMLLLQSAAEDANGGIYWNDPASQGLGAKLRERQYPDAPQVNLAHVLAIIVGYHARFFKNLVANGESGASGGFLEWGPDVEGNWSMKLGAVDSAAGFGKAKYQHTLQALKERVHESGIVDVVRLRNQCALFRFVDAIDIDASRNPAAFIVDASRSAKSIREYLKRQVVHYVELKDGKVSLKSRAMAPDQEMVKAIIKLLQEANSDIQNTLDVSLITPASLLKPWLTAGVSSFLHVLHKPLDDWLERTWSILVSNDDNQLVLGIGEDNNRKDHRNDLKASGLIEFGGGERYVATAMGNRWLATFAALSVAGEVVDEYQAIVDCKLGADGSGVRLGNFAWAEGCDREVWVAGKTTPGSLTVLRNRP